MSRTKTVITISAFIILLVIVFFLFDKENKSYTHNVIDNTQAKVDEKKGSEEDKKQTKQAKQSESIEQNHTDLKLQEQSDCITFSDYFESGLGEKVQNWYSSWGSPKMDYNTRGEARYYENPYYHYSKEQLNFAIEHGDRGAMYAKGMSLIWDGLTGEEKSPFLSSSPETAKFEYLKNINKGKISEGRQLLYESALRGNIYAFTEIAFSYVYEKEASIEALTEEEKQEFDELIAVNGSIPNILIPELDKTYFHSRLSESSEIKKMAVEKVQLIKKDIESRHLPDLKIPKQEDYFDKDNINICR